MKQSRTSHIGVVLFFAVVAFCSPLFFFGCGGAGGDDPIVGGPTLNSLHITGRVVNQSGALPNISAAILPAVPLSGCEVYLESVPTIKTVTDTNGRFTLTPVPAGSHRVVARWLSGAQLFKVRSQVLSVGGANAEANAGDLLAESATYQVKGILKDGQGNPVSGTPMSLWGEVFYTNAQGVYESPLMPGNSEGVISVQNPQYKPIELEFVFSSPNPPYVETVMVPAGQTNRAPDVRVFMNAYSVNAGLQVSLIASATDPDGDQLSYFWSASAGSISTGTYPAQPNWTAPTEGSIATIAVEVRDPGGLSAKYLVQVTILGSGRENTPPRITARFPAPNATGVPLISTVTVSFNETIDASSLNTGNFLLKQGTNPVPGAISFGSLFTQGTFTPAAPLSSGMTYTVELTTGIRDTAGNSLAAKDSWQFTIASSTDSTPPTIVSVLPASGSVNVVASSAISVIFDEPMDPTTLNTTSITLASGSVPVPGSVAVSSDGKTATFTPSPMLSFGSLYVATVATEAKDVAGNPLSAKFSWGFSTVVATASGTDSTPPTILAAIPASGSTSVATSSVLSITFSEPMDPSTLIAANIILASGAVPVSGLVTMSIDFKVATFNPSLPLAYGTLYTASVMTGVKDASGNALASDFTWTFTTADPIDPTPPTVLTVVPASAATGIATSTAVTIVFSEPMDPTSLTTANITLTSGVVPVSGSISTSADGSTATFTPALPLSYETVYSASVSTGAKDAAGNALAAKLAWNFTTAAAPDITPPTVVSVVPASASTNIPTNTVISISFSEPMNATTLTTTNITLASGPVPVSGSIAVSGDAQTAIFTPTGSLSGSSVYTASVKSGVEDSAGNPMSATFAWTFTTSDTADATPPAVVSVVPDNLATDVSTGTLVTANFTEAMNASTINVTTFTLASGTSPITGAIFVSGDGMSATFTPAVSLPLGSVIVATITTGVQDLSGNPMSTSKVWAFTTAIEVDLTAPTMVAIVPASGEINVATNTAVTIAFSESMDPTTLNTTSITLASDGIGISGSVTVSGDSKVATFTPTGALPYGSAIAVTISTGAKDLAGNPLAANVVRAFTTTTAPATPAPLLITEVSSSRFSDSFRWIEIYNTTGASIDLGNYQLRSLTIPRTGGSTTGPVLFVIPALSVPANSYAVVRVKGSDTDIFDGTNLVHIFGAGDMLPYWGADGFVELVDASNQTVDFVRWGADTTAPQTSSKWVSGAAPALPDAYGSSLARPFALDDTDTGADWALRSFPTPGGPNDVSSDTDADVDGIPDVCEQSGATYMGLPVYDWGARVSQKDVFIHIDYMNSVDLGVNPRKDSLDNVVQVFAAHGYTLHPDVGTLFGSGVANHNLDNLSHQIAFSQFLYLGVEAGAANLYEIKATRLPLPKRHLFYYCIFASEQNSGSTGLGEVDGNDFLVSLGNQGFSTATQEDTNFLVHIMAATFMHELGHNLGLYHGGDDPNNNYKPNYLSIMNYLYSNLGVPQVGNPREGDRYYHNQWANDGFAATSAFYQYFSVSGSMQIHNSPWTASFTMDYSYGSGTTLTESNLTESEGLKYPITAGVDWNGNGNVTDPAFSKDVNLSGGSIESYNDYNDWGNLNFIFQQKYQGISNAPGGKIKRPYSFTNSDAQEIADEPPVTLPHRLMK